nr:unnamed protein product [Digitaria exilis]
MDATVVAIAGDGDDSARRPLIASAEEIHPYAESSSPQRPLLDAAAAQPEQQRKTQRVASLDVFRGFTVAMMILVDDAGGAWPGINHAPWFGVTVADFVMPAFLFIIGVSAALVFKRIAIGYFLAAISEIWLVNNNLVDSPVSFVKKYFMEWIMAILITVIYVALLFGLYVSNWEFHVEPSNSTLSIPSNLVEMKTECSLNSPDYGPLPPNAPDWCLAPFDPEGLLSTLTAAVTCFVGLHFGHVLIHCKVDVIHIKKPFILFQWMGMNALIVYILAACELFPTLIQGFYWRSPENNLVDITESVLQAIFHSKRWGTLAFVLLEIVFWCLAAGFLHMKGVYLKL